MTMLTCDPATGRAIADLTGAAGILAVCGGGVFDFFNTVAFGDPQAAHINANGSIEVVADRDAVSANGDAPGLPIGSNAVPDNRLPDTAQLSFGCMVTDVYGFALATIAAASAHVDVQDSDSFAAGSLTSVSFANDAYTFTLLSAAASDKEQEDVDPTTGQATADAAGILAVSLGQINPGDVLSVVTDTSSIAANRVLESTLFAPNGNATETAFGKIEDTWSNAPTTLSSAGAETEIEYHSRRDSDDLFDLFNTAASAEPQAAQEYVNANGSIEVIADGDAVTVNGDAPSLSIGSSEAVVCGIMATLEGFDLAQLNGADAVAAHRIVMSSSGDNFSELITITSGGSDIVDFATCATAYTSRSRSPAIYAGSGEAFVGNFVKSIAFDTFRVTTCRSARSAMTDRANQKFDVHADYECAPLANTGDWFAMSGIVDQMIGADREVGASFGPAGDRAMVCGTVPMPSKKLTNCKMKDWMVSPFLMQPSFSMSQLGGQN